MEKDSYFTWDNVRAVIRILNILGYQEQVDALKSSLNDYEVTKESLRRDSSSCSECLTMRHEKIKEYMTKYEAAYEKLKDTYYLYLSKLNFTVGGENDKETD